jgi:peptidoglycan/LPS O-acetylase OafA/YrhL
VIVPSPAAVRQAGIVVSFEAIVLIGVAVVLVVRHLAGTKDPAWLSGYGTAAWFAIMGSAVLAAGWALWTGRRWGRGLSVFANLLLLPVAYYMSVGSGQWAYGIAVALVAVVALALLFSPSALQWAAQYAQPDSSPDSSPDSKARADNSDPDTR